MFLSLKKTKRISKLFERQKTTVIWAIFINLIACNHTDLILRFLSPSLRNISL